MRYAYITNGTTNTVSVIDTLSQTVINTITVGNNPYGVAVSPNGTAVWISLPGEARAYSTITGDELSFSPVTMTGSGGGGVAFSPDSSKVFIADDSSRVRVYNAATGAELSYSPVIVGGGPLGVAISPDGTKAFVANEGSNTVSAFSTSTGAALSYSPITVMGDPVDVAISPDGSKAFVTNANGVGVSAFNTSDGSSLSFSPISVGSGPWGIAISSTGTAYVSNFLDDTVSVFDTSTGVAASYSPISLGSGKVPRGLAITPDDAYIYVANSGDNTVSVIKTSTHTVVSNIPVGSYPVALGKFIQQASILMTPYTAPQGRLTLTSNTPVMTADALAATSVYYTPYQGNIVPIYDGANMQSYTFGQLTMALNSSNQTSGHIYDLFVFLNSSVVTIAAGPAWSSSTARGTGAGTTELQQIDGLWVNANTITLKNGSTTYSSIPVGEATYVGSVYMTANGQTAMQFKPTSAAGGTNNIAGLWNAYNRVSMCSMERDSTGSYTYSSATWRAANGSNSNRVTWLDGLQQTPVTVRLKVVGATATAGAQIQFGVHLNSVAGPDHVSAIGSPTSNVTDNIESVYSEESFTPQLGLNFVQAMEASINGATASFYPAAVYSLILEGEY